ncbi:MAG: hypothetical protein ACO1SV_21420 [Fimbriimonas sp.]
MLNAPSVNLRRGRTLTATVAPEGGWWLILLVSDTPIGRLLVTDEMLSQLGRGRAIEDDGFLLKGGDTYVELALESQTLGRIAQQDLRRLLTPSAFPGNA